MRLLTHWNVCNKGLSCLIICAWIVLKSSANGAAAGCRRQESQPWRKSTSPATGKEHPKTGDKILPTVGKNTCHQGVRTPATRG